jgi:hypothetical protein
MNENCKVCHREITGDCDYKQGRCPHVAPMVQIQPKDTSKNHFRISMVKSVFRILAGLTLISGQLTITGLLLIFAELLGVAEEMF